jgi:lipoate-protein ligase A
MSGSRWRFVNTGESDGATNMAVDVALAKQLQGLPLSAGERHVLQKFSLAGESLPTVRVYTWHPWAVSLGYNQGTDDLNTDAIARAGFDLVRRPTGGRAILHAEELTYSVVLPAGRKGILAVYNDISRALVAGLRRFGADANLQRAQPDFREAYRHPSSVPCFTSSARYEIEWAARKLVGSAQRRFAGGERDVVLQHGSILCGPAHRQLADLLRVDADSLAQIRNELRTKTADLREITGAPADLAALAACLREGFEDTWEITFETTETIGTP